ncbi:MAG: methyltransferase, TIGR04325 family [Cytophagales bacterium]|nr:methyltransferase, TIGR04325 family [Cytophagales bacterium]
MMVKDFIPPIVSRLKNRLLPSKYGWSGSYTTWQEAQKQSSGYQQVEIVQKVIEAANEVKRGRAAYERDSVLFDSIQYSWPLLAGLMLTAAKSGGRLSVLDFGGSLGSTYFQNRKFLSSLPSVHWNIVEQEEFVSAGKNFEDQTLKFYPEISACVREQKPNVFLFSCVLQYLESPYNLISSVLDFQPDAIIIDNMPFTTGSQRLTVQRVPPTIYEASYPCWILNKKDFINAFRPSFELVENFESPLSIPLDGKMVPYEGFIFRKSETP